MGCFTLQFQLFTKHVYEYCFPCRKVTITGFDLKSYRQCLQKWNAAITAMNEQCDQLGGQERNEDDAHIIQNASYMLHNEFRPYPRFCRVKELFASDL